MKFTELVARARYEFYRLFYPRHISESIKKRRGRCNNCGYCCRNCVLREEKNGKVYCSVYCERIGFNPRCRPFPIDETDRKLVYKECSYYWE